MATAKKASVDAATKNVKALVPVQYDLVDVAVGDTFDVREADLPQLLAVNAVVETAAQSPQLPA